MSYDLIFLDPPYKEKSLENILNKILENKILKNNGIIIINIHKKEKDTFPKNFNIVDEKKMHINSFYLLLNDNFHFILFLFVHNVLSLAIARN